MNENEIIKDENGNDLKLVTVDFTRCKSCYFCGKTNNNCIDIKCAPSEREDNRRVIFVLAEKIPTAEDLFTGIYKSEKFTIDNAHRAFSDV